MINVGNRQADFYDLFAEPRRAGSDILVRAKSRHRVKHEAGLRLKAG